MIRPVSDSVEYGIENGISMKLGMKFGVRIKKWTGTCASSQKKGISIVGHQRKELGKEEGFPLLHS